MEIQGNEGRIYSQEEYADGQQNYANTFSQEPTFTQSQIFGESFVRELIDVEGAKGLKIVNIIDTDGKTGVALVSVDAHGNELPVPSSESKRRAAPQDGPKCPPHCK